MRASKTQSTVPFSARGEAAGAPAGLLSALREVFRNRALRQLQLAWAGSIIGSWAYTVALVVYAYDQGGASAVALVAADPLGTCRRRVAVRRDARATATRGCA